MDTTTRFAIPYPTRDDPLCEAPAQFQAMARKISTSIAVASARVPQFTNLPFARLSNRVSYTLALDYDSDSNTASGNLIFDSVDVDTDNMANLSASNGGIFASRNGIFEVGVYVHLSASNTTNSTSKFTLNILLSPDVIASNGIIDTGDVTWDGGTGNVASYLCSVQEVIYQKPSDPTPGPLFLAQLIKAGAYSGSHNSDQQVAFSVAWARWARDLP